MNTLFKALIILLLLSIGTACSFNENSSAAPDKDNSEEQNPKEEPYRVFLWVSGSANYEYLSNRTGIEEYVKKAEDIGVTHLVIDVKGTTGEVLYDSNIAPMNLNWKGATRERDFDYLGIFLEEAEKRDIKVFASVNVFSGGKSGEQRGIVYEESSKSDWASYTYTKSNGIRSSKDIAGTGTVMLNLSIEEVKSYQLSIIEELISMYPELHGITLDRARWDGGFRGDFSEQSRELFEDFIDTKLQAYPEDIFEWQENGNGEYEKVNGEYFQKWNEWRCSVVFDFFEEAKATVKSLEPDIEFSTYVGAWYGTYYAVGVNWASNRYSPYDNSSYHSWTTRTYHKYGYAQMLDLLMTGNYSYDVTKEEGGGWSVEGMAETANKVTKGDTDVYATLYLNDYVINGDFDGEQFKKAIEMSFKKSKGVSLFDVIYLEDYDSWDSAEEGIDRGITVKMNQ